MLRGLIFGQSGTPDIHKEKFSAASGVHFDFIDDRLNNFAQKRDLLFACDKKMGAAMCADTLLWLSGWLGSWGKYLAVPGYVAIYCAANQYLDRAKLQADFDQALDELFSIYHWCATGQTPAITHDPKFLELLDAVIPFALDCNELILWKLTESNRAEMSDRYIEIFSQSPQRLAFLLNKPEAESSSFYQLLGGLSRLMGNKTENLEQLKLLDVKGRVSGNKWYQFFATTAADAKLKWYGHHFEPEGREALQSRK